MIQKKHGENNEPKTDDLLSQIGRLAKRGHRCIEEGRWTRAGEIGGQIKLIMDQLFARRFNYSSLILDGSNYQAKLAIYKGDVALAEIHLSFVTDVCLGRPGGEWTTQFADALECYSRIAMRNREWDEFACSLEKCAEIRRCVLGPIHKDTLRAEREWEQFLDIMTDPAGEEKSPQVGREA